MGPIHPLEFRILMVLTAGPSYGTEIVRHIEEAEGDRMTLYPANLFRRVRDLLDRGWIEEAAAPKDADPRRTYVRLTDAGREVAQTEARRLRDLVSEAAAHRLLGEA